MALTLTVGAPRLAAAAPQLFVGYDNPRGALANSLQAQTDFQNSLYSFGVDTLESLPGFANDPTLTFGAVGLTAQSNVKYSVSFAALAVSGAISLLDDGPAMAGGTLVPDSFTFSAPVTAFGTFFSNVGDAVTNTITLQLENTLKGTSKNVVVGTYGPSGAFNNVAFAGVTDHEPFNRVTLLESNDYDGVLLDNITAGYLDRVQTLVVTSPDTSQIIKLDSLGQTTVLADRSNGVLAPLGAAHDAAGNAYVGDALLSKVFKIDAAGNLTTLAGAAQGAINPTGVAPDGAGNLLVTNYLTSQITGLTTAGVGSFVAGPAQGLQGPFDAVRDAAGNTYVANLDARQVLKIGPTGQSTVLAGPGQGLFSPLAVAVDSAGDVFVADALLSKVFKITPAGMISTFAGPSAGLIAPTGLQFDDQGTLYVANYLGNNIMTFALNGQGALFANVSRPWDISLVPESGALQARAVNAPEPATGWMLLLGAGTWAAARRRVLHAARQRMRRRAATLGQPRVEA